MGPGIPLGSITSNEVNPHGQDTELEEAVQESAAQKRQRETAGETGKEIAPLSGRQSPEAVAIWVG
jgi:hypothetical protein